jgi:hypothetical protein
MIIMIGLTVALVGVGEMTQDGFGLGFATALILALGASVLAIRGPGIWATLPPFFIIVVTTRSDRESDGGGELLRQPARLFGADRRASPTA